MLALPNQTPGVLERNGLTRAEADRSVLVLLPKGRSLSGAAAATAVLRVLGGVPRAFGGLYLVPALRAPLESAYRLAAAHRSWLSRLLGAEPACVAPGAPCGPDSATAAVSRP